MVERNLAPHAQTHDSEPKLEPSMPRADGHTRPVYQSFRAPAPGSQSPRRPAARSLVLPIARSASPPGASLSPRIASSPLDATEPRTGSFYLPPTASSYLPPTASSYLPPTTSSYLPPVANTPSSPLAATGKPLPSSMLRQALSPRTPRSPQQSFSGVDAPRGNSMTTHDASQQAQQSFRVLPPRRHAGVKSLDKKGQPSHAFHRLRRTDQVSGSRVAGGSYAPPGTPLQTASPPISPRHGSYAPTGASVHYGQRRGLQSPSSPPRAWRA